MKVAIKTPARLHLGLIDLNGDLGRMFGGMGVAIDKPNVILEASASKEFSVKGEAVERVISLATRFFEFYKTESNISINVKKSIPAHVGLGSGTQLALAVGTALARVFKVNASTPELAIVLGRAKRTGVGTAVFAKGGFVVDGGKVAENGVCVSEKFPPLIFRQPFPQNWRFVVAIPNVPKGLTSQQETCAFAKIPPMEVADVGKICRLTMLKLLPSLVERDIENFGDALTEIQVLTGKQFVSAQGGIYSSLASAECVNYMQSIGVHGVGQSSWGPALYGVVTSEDAKQTLAKVQNHLAKSVGGQAFIAKANNKGATVRILK